MTQPLLRPSALWLLAGLTPAAWGQQQTPPPEAPDVGPMYTLQAPAEERLNKIGLNYRLGLNISVDFKRLGGRLAPEIATTGTAVDRNYDNGYNRVDVTGNNHGGYAGTWNWSYSNPNQFQGDHILEQTYASRANAVSDDHGYEPYQGLELYFSHQFLRGEHWKAGLEAGLGYTRLDIQTHQAVRNDATRTSDSYFGPGVEAWPAPPGPQTFDGPGAVISAAPDPAGRTSDVLRRGALTTGNHELDADVFLLRMGPYVEFPLTQRLSAILSGGLVLGVTHSHFSYNETVSIADLYLNTPVTATHTGSNWETDFLVGGYAAASLSFKLTEDFSLVVGAQFQAQGDSTSTLGGKKSVLDLGQSVFVTIGATYGF